MKKFLVSVFLGLALLATQTVAALAQPIEPPPPSGTLTVIGGQTWQPGQVKAITLQLKSYEPTQFIVSSFVSTCNVQGLPQVFVGDPEKFEETRTWNAYLPENANPGTCMLLATVFAGGENFQVISSFNVPYGLISPILTP